MKKLAMWIALGMLLAGVACAQDISGDWQGDLVDGRQVRVVFRIAKRDGGAWTATMYSIDQSGGEPILVNSVTLTHADFKLRVDARHLTYQGKLSGDASLIRGTATQISGSRPLELRRPTRETAYQFTPVNHARLKFRIATDDTIDGPSFVLAAFFSGLSQIDRTDPSFGQGTVGYLHRYVTGLADQDIGNYMTEAIMPTLLHEDPRYFRKGTGSVISRILWAARASVVARSDSGKWTFNASEWLGNGIKRDAVFSARQQMRVFEAAQNLVRLLDAG